MTNRYFDYPASLSRFVKNTLARAGDINARLDEVSGGFDDVQTEMDAKAPLASPALTGTPTAPNAASVATDTTQIATTAWVQDVVDVVRAEKAPLASPALTGTPTAPNAPSAGTSTAQIATTAWVQLALGAATGGLPPQATHAGKVLGTDGTSAAWGSAPLERSARTANTALGSADGGQFIDITSGSFTQTFDAAASLGTRWWCWIRNAGTGDITLDPSGAETIDGLTSFVMYPGEARLVQCDGSALRSIVVTPFARTFTTSGTFTTPPGYQRFEGLLWGGGGGGGKSNDNVTPLGATGGGGGACVPFSLSAAAMGASQSVGIASGGAAQTGAGAGGVGGTSSLGSLVSAFGGGGGANGSAHSGGTGGGALSAGASGGGGSASGGRPHAVDFSAQSALAHGGGWCRATSDGGDADFGGSAAGGNGGGPAFASGKSIYGGAGGGSVGTSGAAAPGGSSVFGGAGGAAGTSSSGVDGTAPGGGGGATRSGTTSGAGARGELRIWGVV